MSKSDSLSRRQFIRTAAFGAAYAGMQLSLPRPLWAANQSPGLTAIAGTRFDLSIGSTPITVDGKRSRATGINGTVPGPLLRWREGDTVTLNVRNNLDESSSLHWHGLLLPSNMDGVPGLSFDGIGPGDSYRYEFPVRQNGTYWYHSHSGFQEQTGVYGPIIIEPAGPDPVEYDRDFVILLSDWTFEDPDRIMTNLKIRDDYYNYNRRTLGEFFADTGNDGLAETARDRLMWGSMRMKPADIADITAASYTYLLNGLDPVQNWTGEFRPGERVRLRLINGSAQTFFNFRIPGLEMTVVQSDGQHVEPVTVDEIQIGVAETYDVVVRPDADSAYTLFAETMDRSGFARGTLAARPGLEAPVPALRKPPRVTMRDMGMAHGSHGHAGMSHDAQENTVEPGPGSHAEHGGHDMDRQSAGMTQDAHDHAGMHGEAADGPAMPDSSMLPTEHAHATHHDASSHGAGHHEPAGSTLGLTGPVEHDHRRGPGVANVVATPHDRLDEPGQGLEDVEHRVLRYSQLRNLDLNPDARQPGRLLELHLTGNMERYMWSFDGVKYSEVTGPIRFHYGERLRLVLVNDTMMSHPIHLHGMFVELVNGNGHRNPRKHTVVVKPAERLAVDVTADEPGHWAFHCHMLYHMKAGMMRSVMVADAPEAS